LRGEYGFDLGFIYCCLSTAVTVISLWGSGFILYQVFTLGETGLRFHFKLLACVAFVDLIYSLSRLVAVLTTLIWTSSSDEKDNLLYLTSVLATVCGLSSIVWVIAIELTLFRIIQDAVKGKKWSGSGFFIKICIGVGFISFLPLAVLGFKGGFAPAPVVGFELTGFFFWTILAIPATCAFMLTIYTGCYAMWSLQVSFRCADPRIAVLLLFLMDVTGVYLFSLSWEPLRRYLQPLLTTYWASLVFLVQGVSISSFGLGNCLVWLVHVQRQYAAGEKGRAGGEESSHHSQKQESAEGEEDSVDYDREVSKDTYSGSPLESSFSSSPATSAPFF
jgi:hypothetical protein